MLLHFEILKVMGYLCRTKTKKHIALFFVGFAFLLASGLVQFGLHACKKSGVVVSKDDCLAHHGHGKSTSCCDDIESSSEDENQCCNDKYVLSISPLHVVKKTILFNNFIADKNIEYLPFLKEKFFIEGKTAPITCNQNRQQSISLHLLNGVLII